MDNSKPEQLGQDGAPDGRPKIPTIEDIMRLEREEEEARERLRAARELIVEQAKAKARMVGDRINGRPIAGDVLIAMERGRQLDREGWTSEHDDEHSNGELSVAAACYAVAGLDGVRVLSGGTPTRPGSGDAFPWADEFDKRTKHSRKRCLVIAGALLAAEIDRLTRAEIEASGENMPPSPFDDEDLVAKVMGRILARYRDDQDIHIILDAYSHLSALFIGLSGMEGRTIEFSGLAVRQLVGLLAQAFVDTGAQNYCQWELRHNELGPLTVTVQRKNHKSPADVAGDLRERIEAAKKAIRDLKRDELFAAINGLPFDGMLDSILGVLSGDDEPMKVPERGAVALASEIDRRENFIAVIHGEVKRLATMLRLDSAPKLHLAQEIMRRCEKEKADIENSRAFAAELGAR